MRPITSIAEISIGLGIVDTNGENCKILSIYPAGELTFDGGVRREDLIEVQHYPNTKWYIATVECEKCGGHSEHRVSPINLDKFVCPHQVKKEGVQKAYPCGGKKTKEINRKLTGISCRSNYSFSNLIKEFQIL